MLACVEKIQNHNIWKTPSEFKPPAPPPPDGDAHGSVVLLELVRPSMLLEQWSELRRMLPLPGLGMSLSELRVVLSGAFHDRSTKKLTPSYINFRLKMV